MKSEILKWDSNFFNFGVAGVTGEFDEKAIAGILESLKLLKIRLVYYFSNSLINWNTLFKNTYEIQYVNEKVRFVKNLDNSKNEVDSQIINCSQLHPDLVSLAIESGNFSRFRIDNKISKKKFEELYTLWIKNSLNKKIADEVFIINGEDIIKGLMSISLSSGDGIIGLAAVNSNFRGQKLGTKLLIAVEEYCKSHNINKLYVSSQAENIIACKFYESHGFLRDNEEYVYHIWL